VARVGVATSEQAPLQRRIGRAAIAMESGGAVDDDAGGIVADGEVTAGPLSTRKVLRIAAHGYRRWFWRLAFTAAIVFGAAAVLAVTADVAVEHIKHDAPQPYETALAAYVVIGRFGGSLALVFYAGFLDLYVGGPLYEGRQPTFRQVLRELPWARLIVADALLAVATQVGLLLFVVPGLLIFTLYALVGPLIIVEGHGTRPAFRRSRSLVWRHFLLVAGVVTLPAMSESLLETGVHTFFGVEHFMSLVVVSAAVGIVVGAYCGLMEVIITRELIGEHPLEEA
jgi:hypothetical protein